MSRTSSVTCLQNWQHISFCNCKVSFPTADSVEIYLAKIFHSFSFCYVNHLFQGSFLFFLLPQLQSTCNYIVNHYVKIWHVRLWSANYMHPLRWGESTNGSIFFGSILFRPQCFLLPPVTYYMLLYSALLCKKIAHAPGSHKKFMLTKLGGGGQKQNRSVFFFVKDPVSVFVKKSQTEGCYVSNWGEKEPKLWI